MFSLIFRSATRILFTGFPFRVGIGMLIGLTFNGIGKFFVGYLPLSSVARGLNALPLYSEVAVGLLLSFCAFLLPGRRMLPERVTLVYDVLDEHAARLKMSDHQKYLLYQSSTPNLIEKILTSVNVDPQELIKGPIADHVSDRDKDEAPLTNAGEQSPPSHRRYGLLCTGKLAKSRTAAWS